MPSKDVLKAVAIVTAGCLTVELLYWAYIRLKLQRNQPGPTNIVLFFPDKKLACRSHFSDPSGCLRKDCRFSHERTSLSQLLDRLRNAKTSLDLCLFVITCHELADMVVAVHNGGVRVRVITDGEQQDITGSQIGKLRKAGIRLRTNQGSHLMHHKFVIVDDTHLINGSFNWTRQAVTCNNENVLITNNTEILEPYLREFNRLWGEFDPNR